MNFSAWSIRNPVAPLLAFFLLMVLGWQSFNSLPITRFPNIDVPVIAVTVTQPGAAPAELETQVTKIVEDAVAGIVGAPLRAAYSAAKAGIIGYHDSVRSETSHQGVRVLVVAPPQSLPTPRTIATSLSP